MLFRSMGRDSSGIFQTLRDAALIQQTGGGNGFSFSKLRHKGSLVKSSAGMATGPVGFLRVYDKAFGEIAQGGTRRGANMAVLRVDHPDIRDFITCKVDENQITNFNISVGVTDAFMQAVKDDTTYDLVAPHSSEVVETVQAREIFDMMVKMVVPTPGSLLPIISVLSQFSCAAAGAPSASVSAARHSFQRSSSGRRKPLLPRACRWSSCPSSLSAWL